MEIISDTVSEQQLSVSSPE